MNGRVKKLLHPYNIERSNSGQTTTTTCQSDRDIGYLISTALGHMTATSAISDSWRLHFGEESCPLCDCRKLSLEQIDEVPCFDSFSWERHGIPNSLAALKQGVRRLDSSCEAESAGEDEDRHRTWRCLSTFCRTRDLPAFQKSSAVIVNLQGGIRVEILQSFDFHLLRHLLLGNDVDLINSLRATRPLTAQGGKSRSRFFESVNGRFIIKSLLPSELRNWERNNLAFLWYYMIGKYRAYPSILVPFLGVFVVHDGDTSEARAYIVMRNIARHDSVSMTFDLKGMGPQRCRRPASVSRSISNCSELPLGKDDVLLDGDLRSLWKNEPIIVDGPLLDFLRLSLDNDTLFLSALDSVDYSMILSFETTDSFNSELDCLSVGIVDYLRPFTWDKRLESVVKSINTNIISVRDRIPWRMGGAQLQDAHKGSALELENTPTIIRPDLYARRFRSNILSLFKSFQ